MKLETQRFDRMESVFTRDTFIDGNLPRLGDVAEIVCVAVLDELGADTQYAFKMRVVGRKKDPMHACQATDEAAVPRKDR